MLWAGRGEGRIGVSLLPCRHSIQPLILSPFAPFRGHSWVRAFASFPRPLPSAFPLRKRETHRHDRVRIQPGASYPSSYPYPCVRARDDEGRDRYKVFPIRISIPRYDAAWLAWLDLDRAAGRMLASLSRF